VNTKRFALSQTNNNYTTENLQVTWPNLVDTPDGYSATRREMKKNQQVKEANSNSQTHMMSAEEKSKRLYGVWYVSIYNTVDL
jgi:hypothetical protein